ncbi:enoyl-CoA hydratase-related protein [Amycolatopsis sp. GM8]|uniref:enoyl-CoA hydratase-related protein n=1 Tax=Amycolatopsis sp. GM8 TaxID=2896530 RepID=UPI001EFFE190|nr:enoyl-CoA hydratase-related protein [Amycolatopsis sp. GM8]
MTSHATAAETTGEPLVKYEVNDGVALITWNRPHRRNAWTPAMEAEYFGLLRTAAADGAVRAIVVTGAGGNFCPGTDMTALFDAANGSRANNPEDREPQTLAITIPKPIIAAIEGACAGTGFIQACVCDIRFATPDAKITAAFVRRGIMAEHGLAVLVPALVGTANAMDILLSGRVIRGTEAAQMGLVRLSENALDDALAYARDLAANASPQALAVTKMQMYSELRAPVEKARLTALKLWQTLREHDDFKEGVRSFQERRPPRFAPVGEAELDRLEKLWTGTGDL